jgi:hypothetical protein
MLGLHRSKIIMFLGYASKHHHLNSIFDKNNLIYLLGLTWLHYINYIKPQQSQNRKQQKNVVTLIPHTHITTVAKTSPKHFLFLSPPTTTTTICVHAPPPSQQTKKEHTSHKNLKKNAKNPRPPPFLLFQRGQTK